MTLGGYAGPPLHKLAADFVQAWQGLRQAVDTALKLPNLEDDVEKKYHQLEIEVLNRSNLVNLVSEEDWGLHIKVKGFLNGCHSLDYLRQETQIMHDNIRNQWHDIYIQATKMVSVFEEEFEKEQQG